MNLLSLLNASLQTIATALVVFGADLVNQSKTTEGVILIVAGLAAYVIYELVPQKPQQ